MVSIILWEAKRFEHYARIIAIEGTCAHHLVPANQYGRFNCESNYDQHRLRTASFWMAARMKTGERQTPMEGMLQVLVNPARVKRIIDSRLSHGRLYYLRVHIINYANTDHTIDTTSEVQSTYHLKGPLSANPEHCKNCSNTH